jgi:hypothetical protein
VKGVTQIIMATVNRNRRGGSFRPTEPGRSKDINWYMDYKLNKYIDYLDSIDNGLYCLEYDTDIPTIDELLNGIDQHLLSSGYAKSDALFDRENRLRKEEEAKLKVEQDILESQKFFWENHRHLVAQLEAKGKQEALEREERKRLKEIAEIKKEARLKEKRDTKLIKEVEASIIKQKKDEDRTKKYFAKKYGYAWFSTAVAKERKTELIKEVEEDLRRLIHGG